MFVEPSRKWPIWKFASKESLTYTAGQNFKVQPPSEDGEATLQAGSAVYTVDWCRCMFMLFEFADCEGSTKDEIVALQSETHLHVNAVQTWIKTYRYI